MVSELLSSDRLAEKLGENMTGVVCAADETTSGRTVAIDPPPAGFASSRSANITQESSRNHP